MAANASAVLGSTGRAKSRSLRSAWTGGHLVILDLSDSNALQSTGSHWAAFRNAFRTRGVPNFAAWPHQPTWGSWASALIMMGQQIVGGRIPLTVGSVHTMPRGSIGTTAPDVLDTVAFKSTETPGTSGNPGGTAPTLTVGGTPYAVTPNGWMFHTHGIHATVAAGDAQDDVGAANSGTGFSTCGLQSADAARLATATPDGSNIYRLDQPLRVYCSRWVFDAAGRVAADVRLGASPSTVIASHTVGPGAADSGWVDFTLDIPAGTALSSAGGALRDLQMRACTAAAGFARMAFMQPPMWVRTDLATGVCVGVLWAEGGESLHEGAKTLLWLHQNRPYAIREVFRRILQVDPEAHVCIRVKHKGNDFDDAVPSVAPDGSAGPNCNTAAGYAQNVETVAFVVEAGLQAAIEWVGASESAADRMHVVDGGYHPQPAATQAARNAFQVQASEAVAALFDANPQWNGLAIDAQRYVTDAEMIDQGWYLNYAGGNTAHLSAAGYTELALRELDSITLAADAAAGGAALGAFGRGVGRAAPAYSRLRR